MTEIPKPRFGIGDRVYFASWSTKEESLPCPDCAGTQKWKVVMASGELETSCQRCTGYMANLPKSRVTVPEVQSIIVRGMRFSSHTWGQENVWEYSSQTQGGQIVTDSTAHATYDSAMEEAKIRAAESQRKYEEKNAEQIKRERNLAPLAFMDAEKQVLKESEFDSRYKYDQLQHSIKNMHTELEYSFPNLKNSDWLEIQRYLLKDECFEQED